MTIKQLVMSHRNSTPFLIIVVCILIFYNTACSEGLSKNSSIHSRHPFSNLIFHNTEIISHNTFPPFTVKRTYDSESTFQGVFGERWWCWPFDTSLEKTEIKKTEILTIHGKNGEEERFVLSKNNLFIPLNPSKAKTISLKKTHGGYVLTDLLNGRQFFDNSGRLVKVSDKRGQKFDIVRSKEGLPVSATVYLPQRKTYKITCDPDRKRLTTISASDGRTWEYDYDKADNLVKVKDETGNVTIYKYKKKLLIEQADSFGIRMSYKYDGKGRLVEIDRNGRKEYRKYNKLSSANDWMVTTIDPIGRKSEYRFLTSDRREVIREKDGNVVVRQYDEDWQLQHISSTKDGVISFERDKTGQPIGILDPLDRLIQIRYDNALGLPSTIIDNRGQVWKFRYNTYGQLISALRPNGREFSMQYNRFGLPLLISDTIKGKTRFLYNETGNLEAINNESLGFINTANTKSKNDLSAFLKRTAFINLPVPEQRLRLIRLLSQAVQTGYDRDKRSLTVHTKDGEEWICRYDQFGNMEIIQKNSHPVAKFQYDAVDRLLEIRYSKTELEQFEYDIGDQVVKYIDPNQQVFQYSYDLKGYILKETLPNGEENVFDYDMEGHLISAFNSFWHDLFSYDSIGQLVKVGRLTPVSKSTESLVAYTYNKAGRLESTLFANGIRCSYEYNNTSDMEKMYFMDKKIIIQYDSNGRCRSVHYPGGIKVEYGYTKSGSLSRLAVKDSSGKTLLSQFCQYQNGRVDKIFSKAPERMGQYTFAYNSAGQVKKVMCNGQAVEKIGDDNLKKSYDALGRLRLTGMGKDLTEYTYGLGGVLSTSTKDNETYFLRSSDSVARAVIYNGHVRFILPSAIPNEVFIYDQHNSNIHPIQFRDTTRPAFGLKKGGLS